MRVSNVVVIDNTVTFVSPEGGMVSFKDVHPKSIIPYETDCTTIEKPIVRECGRYEPPANDELLSNIRRKIYAKLGRDSNG